MCMNTHDAFCFTPADLNIIPIQMYQRLVAVGLFPLWTNAF